MLHEAFSREVPLRIRIWYVLSLPAILWMMLFAYLCDIEWVCKAREEGSPEGE